MLGHYFVLWLPHELLFAILKTAVSESLLTKYLWLNAKLAFPSECVVLNGLLGACK